MVTDADYSELDAKALEVLEAVFELGGEANTSEIKEYTGIRKNGIIHYRYEKLEEAGMIETHTGEPDGNKVPPTVATLTEHAQSEIEGGLFGEEEADIVERIDRVERGFETTQDAVREMQREFQMWRFDEENDEEIDAADLRDRLEEIEELGEELRQHFDIIESFKDDQYVDSLKAAFEGVKHAAENAREEASHNMSDIHELAYHLATVDRDDLQGNPNEPDVWEHLENEPSRLDELEAAVKNVEGTANRAKEAGNRASEKATNAEQEASDAQEEVEELREQVETLQEQVETLQEQSGTTSGNQDTGLLSSMFGG